MSAQAARKNKRWLGLCYPHMKVDDSDDPNAKREVIKKPNYYKNHFRLTEEKEELLETTLDVII